MSYLYKLVTTENVDLNYKAFKKDELIECIVNMRTTYFRLREENQKYKEAIDKAKELLNNHTILLPTEYSDEVANFKRNLRNILKEVE